MWTITLVLIVLTILTGTSCQKVMFDEEGKVTTPCVGSATPPVFYYFFPVLLEPKDYSKEWLPSLQLEILRTGAKEYQFLCPLDVTTRRCTTHPVDLCRCDYSREHRKIDINLTIHERDSRARIRIRWFDDTGENCAIGGHMLPKIVVAQTPKLLLSVDGVYGTLYSGSCTFRSGIAKGQVLHVCCNSTITPCYTRIEFDGIVVATNGTPCVTYTAQTAGRNVTMVLSYAFCSKMYYTVGGNCIHPKGIDSVLMTTPRQSSRNSALSVPRDYRAVPEGNKCKPVPTPATRAPPPTLRVVTTATSVPDRRPSTDETTMAYTDYPDTDTDDLTTDVNDLTTADPKSQTHLRTMLLATLITSILIGVVGLTVYWFHGRQKVKAEVKPPPTPRVVSPVPSIAQDSVRDSNVDDAISSAGSAVTTESGGTDV